MRSRIEGTAGEIQLRPGYPVVLGMVLVVLSFAASLGYSHFLLQPVDEQALALTQNAIPSLQHLANMRVALAHFGRIVRDAVAAGRSDFPPMTPAIDAARARIESEFHLYRALTTSSAEAQWVRVVDQRLAQLERATDRVRNATDVHGGREALQKLFEPALAQTDAATDVLRHLNEAQARENAARILRAREHATLMATLLGSASLAIAFLATLLVLRILQSRSRIVQEYLRMQAERNAELEAFAGRVAHDLRDPLSAITLQVSVVKHLQPREPELMPHFNAIDRQLQRTDQMIGALLEFARAGAAPASGARADLAEVLNTVLAGVRPRLETIEAELTVAPVPPLEVACTPGALGSVISNLVGNAAKFVVEGSQLPRCIAVRVREEGSAARIEVEDNGPGIPVEAEEHIFEPFRRLHGTRQSGFGLGLATVKKIVEAYQGRVGVRSRPARGSVFWFELPKATPERAVSPH